MLFHSQQFLVFFVVVFAVFWLLPSLQLRKWFVLLSSCVFYMSWNAWFLLLIFFTTAVDFLAGLYLERHSSSGIGFKRAIVAFSVSINLLVLFYFKYANFFISSFSDLSLQLGLPAHNTVLNVVLPLGISFYTFEAISYVVDVYKGRIKACKSFLDYATFIMFFPHLIAGPIVRARDFLPQLARTKRFSWANITFGAQLLILGLFKKVIVADYLAQVADPVFANPLAFGTSSVWLAALAYTGQIFCDFSGYSDMALGLARMLGFRLRPNFILPYLASDIADFWRRWHISLSTWIRDYLYIPIGGSKYGVLGPKLNLLITMLLCGLWHGANWQFIVWGAYHGALLLVNQSFKGFGLKMDGAWKLFSTPFTFLLVMLGWVMFRAENLQIAGRFYRRMFAFHEGGSLSTYLCICFAMAFGCFIFGHFGARFVGRQRMFQIPPPLMAAGMSAMLFLVLILRPEERTRFIYFQF